MTISRRHLLTSAGALPLLYARRLMAAQDVRAGALRTPDKRSRLFEVSAPRRRRIGCC